MRPIREITQEEENFRVEPVFPSRPDMRAIRRDPVEPEPVGTIILCAFRIIGYNPDCDGSLMAHLEQIDKEGQVTGWNEGNVGLYPNVALVVTQEELTKMFQPDSPKEVQS